MNIVRAMAVKRLEFYNANYFHRQGYAAEGAR